MLLAQAGYQVTGADMSEEMLTVAYDKAVALPDNRPFFVCQNMERLCLPEPVDWVLCSLDSINYLTDPAACQETFRRVYRSLCPGGVFIFDVNTPEKLRAMDGQVFLDEDEDVFCVWRGSLRGGRADLLLWHGPVSAPGRSVAQKPGGAQGICLYPAGVGGLSGPGGLYRH